MTRVTKLLPITKNLTIWQMFLYWYKPSLARWLFLRSTQSSKYRSIIGSCVFCHVRWRLLFITSYKTSRACSGLSTPINSKSRMKDPRCYWILLQYTHPRQSRYLLQRWKMKQHASGLQKISITTTRNCLHICLNLY